MDNTKILELSLETYDANNSVVNNFMNYIGDAGENSVPYSKLIVPKDGHDNIRSKIQFELHNGEIFESDYEVLGVYYTGYKLWISGWADILLKKSQSTLSKKTIMYGLELDNQSDALLKTILTTPKTIINEKFQLDIFLAVSSYLIKKKYIYPYAVPIGNNGHKFIQYLIIIDEENFQKISSMENGSFYKAQL